MQSYSGCYGIMVDGTVSLPPCREVHAKLVTATRVVTTSGEEEVVEGTQTMVLTKQSVGDRSTSEPYVHYTPTDLHYEKGSVHSH